MCQEVCIRKAVSILPIFQTIWKLKGNLLKDYNAPGVEHITNEELLTCECDVLIPAALENQITAEVAEKSEMFLYYRSSQRTNQ